MQIFNEPNYNPNLSIALGFFDGVHYAHRKIINKTVELASNHGLKSAIITFSKSPASYFSERKFPYICNDKKKLEIFEQLGVDFVYMLDFSQYKDLAAHKYLNDILIKNFEPKYIVTGFNHTFGNCRIGNSLYLKEHQGKYEYIEIEKIRLENTLVSSTNIRKLLQKGYIHQANRLLDSSFEIMNKVIDGQKLARTLGYKTANINWQENLIKLPYGVYSASVKVPHLQDKMPALVNWGVKPTISDEKKEILEAHILEFNQDIYGQQITVSFEHKIRDEMRFSNLDDLAEQIKNDLEILKIKCS